MDSLKFLIAVMLVVGGECGNNIPKKKCGTLYSDKESQGEKFVLNDFDQFGFIASHYQNNLVGWKQTGSVHVEDTCTLKICRSEGLKDPCSDLVTGNEKPFFPLNNTRSASCACKRDCKCEDISIPKDKSKNPTFGRFYFKGGCSTCDSEYVPLQSCDASPAWQPKKTREIESIVLRSGCTITVFSERNFRGVDTLIAMPIFKGRLTVLSYNVSCNDAEFVEPPAQPKISSNTPKIILPSTKEELKKMSSLDATLAAHPGYQAAVQSAENGRSPRNAYVVIIGTHDPSVIGFPQCQAGKKEEIGECRIPVELDDLGITSELRVITVPMTEDASRPTWERIKSFNAHFDIFLTTHDELKHITPNAVIVHHRLIKNEFKDNDTGPTPINNRLMVLEAQRSRIVDERLSNVLFLFYIPKGEKNIDDIGEYIKNYDTQIEKKYNLPKPFASCVKSTTLPAEATFVNGYKKMEHGEFWPKNLEILLGNICGDGGDPLGKAIFEAALQDSTNPEDKMKQLNDTSVDDDEVTSENEALCYPHKGKGELKAKKIMKGLGKVFG